MSTFTYHLSLIIYRFRHWRGHGVHSPFVYSLVREVFMRRLPLERELEEVFLCCRARSFGVNCVVATTGERRRLAREHSSTSIERRGYILLLQHDDLPKQHYRL